MKDRQLPQAIDAEKAILGTCLMNPNIINDIGTMLQPEMFYVETHKFLYNTILEVAKKTGSADLITVCDILRVKGKLDSYGGVIGLTKMTDGIVTDVYVIKYITIVIEKYLLRQYIQSGMKLSNLAYEEDLAEVKEYAESSILDISNIIMNKEPKRIDRCVDEYLIEIEKIINKEKSLSGVASGFTSIDRITGGWQPSDLIIIAGRPSMGKTAVALSLARGAAEMKFPVAIFSLEMSERQVTGRYMSAISGLTNMQLREGKVDLEELGLKSNDIALLPIYVDDTPAITLFELRSKIKKLLVRENIQLVIVDYLQLMKADAKSREQEVSQISRGLKAIAKEFNIPVIAVSQLNRDVEARADKKPRLSDLRESGAIEQDADIVCFIHRPDYYGMGPIVTINGYQNYSVKGLMVLDIAKNRNGICLAIPLFHNEAMSVITDLEESTGKEDSFLNNTNEKRHEHDRINNEACADGSGTDYVF